MLSLKEDMRGLCFVGHRSRDLLKYKCFDDSEFKIVDVIEGVGKFEGHGVFIVQNDLTDITVEVDMNCPMEKKEEFLANREVLIGKMLTVQYQGRTAKNQVPRFPRGLRIREEE